jgi:hypothetical protein
MKSVGIALGLLVLLVVVYVATRKSPSIEAELAKLTPGDRQAIESLAAAAGLTANRLHAVEPGVLKYNARALVVQDGRVVELRLSKLPLQKLDGLAALTALRELWLDGDSLTSAAGVAALPALRKLNLSHNALTRVADLRELPALTDLDLSDNQIADLTPLTALPALQTLDVSKNPIKALPSPLPKGWNMKSDQAPAGSAAPGPGSGNDHPSNWVAKPPANSGKAKNGKLSGFVTADSFEVNGSLAELQGAVAQDNISGPENAGGAGTTLTLTVEKGRVRGYLQYVPPGPGAKFNDGYVYAEAEAGKPGQVKGVLPTLGGGFGRKQAFHLVLESVDGPAEGITFKLSR